MRTAILTAALAATTACLPAPPDADFDGDGYDFDADCDDRDDTVHPGAEEIWYDGVDQDCDGASDYDADGDGHDSQAYGGDDCNDDKDFINPDAEEEWYDGVDYDCDGADDFDQDGDGHKAEEHGGEDCDDENETVYPGADEEWYDGTDQDCDGWSDFDKDGDLWECQGGVSPGCPKDHVGEDCDDTDISVGPGSIEYVDGIDNDCNGIQDDVPWHDRSEIDHWSTGIIGEENQSWGGLGQAVSTMPFDLCNPTDRVDATFQPGPDGIPDLLVSAPAPLALDGTDYLSHAVYLVPGDSADTLQGKIAQLAVLRIEEVGTTAGVDSGFGAWVDFIPDLDSDGVAEIMVEAPGRDEDHRGTVYVFLSTTWEGEATSQDNLWTLPRSAADLRIEADETGDGTGQSISAGDLNGDGRPDLVIGEPSLMQEGGSYGEDPHGGFRLFWGPSTDAIAGDGGTMSVSEADLTLWGSDDFLRLGEVRPVVHDVDLDGANDLIVSTPYTTDERGIVAIWSGVSIQASGKGAGPMIDHLDRRIEGVSGSHEGVGRVLAAGGDLNGDGYAEIVASALNGSADFCFLVLDGDLVANGAARTDTAATQLCTLTLANPEESTFRVSATGDFNQDAYSDLALGVPPLGQEDDGGYVGLLYGWSGLTGTLVDSDLQSGLDGPDDARLGSGAVMANDVTGDGVPDLLLGGPGVTTMGSDGSDAAVGMLWILDPSQAWPE